MCAAVTGLWRGEDTAGSQVSGDCNCREGWGGGGVCAAAVKLTLPTVTPLSKI